MSIHFCLAAAQTLSVPGDLTANIERHCAFVHAAAEAGVELLLFPELSLSGYEPELVAGCVVDPTGDLLAPLRSLAQQHAMTLVLGAPLASAGERPHIGAIVLFADGSHTTYHKRHLHPGEEHWATPGTADCSIHSLGEQRFALSICADLAHPEHAQAAAQAGARLYLSGVLISEQGYAADCATLQGHAGRHGFGVLMANHGGPSGGYLAAGRSAFWDADGQLIGACSGPGEQLLILREQAASGWSAELLTP